MKANGRPGRWLIILPPLIFLLLFFLVPFGFAFKISFAQCRGACAALSPTC